MVQSTAVRRLQAEERQLYTDISRTFGLVIEQGTNCSAFEAQIIAQKAQEAFRVGPYADRDAPLQPGQMVWRAIAEDEPPGKPLQSCRYEQVVLTVHSIEEDREVFNKHGRSAKRAQQILRMCSEAQDQGALLTQEHLAWILDCDVKTIGKDIKSYQQLHGVLIPTRGNKLDIGPGITHREKAVELFIKGYDPLSIAATLKHSLKAIERYTQTFCRVVYCQEQVQDSLKTAMIVGISVALVNRYLALCSRLSKTGDYRERLSEIQKVGSRLWDCQDAKKKLGRMKRRSR
ncbi:MAG: DUF1670 domain-containing protein [Chitinivibrionales bacterium]|nr:DUF1670 domain-containing protein [Chitinivibrionales bacterium]